MRLAEWLMSFGAAACTADFVLLSSGSSGIVAAATVAAPAIPAWLINFRLLDWIEMFLFTRVLLDQCATEWRAGAAGKRGLACLERPCITTQLLDKEDFLERGRCDRSPNRSHHLIGSI